MAQKSMALGKLLTYLKEHGSIETAEWYAQQLDMPIKNSQYMVAYRVFKEYDENDEFDDSVINITLCRYLWQKFVGDKEIGEMVAEVIAMNKYKRREGLKDLLYDLNIEYPQSDRIIKAIYFLVPELRTAEPGEAESLTKSVYERLDLKRTATSRNCSSIEQQEEAEYEYDDDFDVEDDDDERFEEGSPSEMWYRFFDDNMNNQNH